MLTYSSVFVLQRFRRKSKMDLVKTLSEQYMKPELPTMNVGDTVRVTVRVRKATAKGTRLLKVR